MKRFKTYTFLIGAHEDFEDMDQLLDYFENAAAQPQAHRPHSPNAAAHEFVVPAGLDRELVTYIGRGIAFSNDWCMDGTFSCIVDGALDPTAPRDVHGRPEIDDDQLYGVPV